MARCPEHCRAEDVRQHLDRVLSDPVFSGANRRSRLLRFLVEHSLEDRGEVLKESVIATEVFEKSPNYDPQIDSAVRVEVGRLRARLAEYYAQAGADAPVRIEIPKGSYRPVFVFREGRAAAHAEPVRLEEPRKGRTDWRPVATGAVALAAMVTALAIWLILIHAPAKPVALAVMPFRNVSGDSTDDYLGDGISEELTETLAEFDHLRVVTRTSAFQYKGKTADARAIGRQLGVNALIEGSVARRAGQFHVVAQLIRTSDGYHLWSHTYDAALAEFPAVESGIATAVREMLVPSSPAAARDITLPSGEARDLYLRAAYELNRHTVDSTRQAIEMAGQALEQDPSFAQPYVLMAAGESQLNTLLAQPPHQGAERALADIAKALSLDPGNSGAHAQKALLTYTDRWDWPQAEREFRLTLDTGSHGSAENLYGWCLMTRGRFAEARRHLAAAAEMDPLSLGPQLNQVTELMNERAYPEADRKVRQILQTAPANPVGLYLASAIAFWQRDCRAATVWSGKLMEIAPGSGGAMIARNAADSVCGRRFDGEADLAKVTREYPSAYLSPYGVAAEYALANNADQAMAFLQKSADLREPVLLSLKVDRAFDRIRRDPRFLALERRLGLLE